MAWHCCAECRGDGLGIVIGLGIGIGLWSEYVFVGQVFGWGPWPAIAVVVAAGALLDALERGGLCWVRQEAADYSSLTRWLAVVFGLC